MKVQNNDHMATYTANTEHAIDPHIYADLTGEVTRRTNENVDSSDVTTQKSKLIPVRYCVICFLASVFVSSGITTAGFLAYKNTLFKNYDTSQNKTMPVTSINESNSIEYHAISFMRSVCPIDWFSYDSSCYNLYEEKKTWIQAQAFCVNIGANLLSIHSFSESASVINNLTGEKSGRAYWIGFTDFKEENRFKWSDKSQTDFTMWNVNEPNDFNNFEDCAEISKRTFAWNDNNCYIHHGFICKMNLTDKCGNGNWLLFKDRCYLFKKISGTWIEANRICNQRNSKLISINSDEEHYFVTSQASIISGSLWIGLRRENSNSGNYVWSDGKNAKNIPWGRYPPSEEECVYLKQDGNGNFLSFKCTEELDGFICEKPGR